MAAMVGGLALASAAPARAASTFALEPVALELTREPFTPTDAVTGFVRIGDGPPGITAFHGKAPPVATSPGLLPVLDFRISIAGFEWTPATGDFGILGFLSAGRRIESLVFGAERADCGPAFTPCFLDLVDLGTRGTFRLEVYRPADTASGAARIDLYRATGVSFERGRMP